MSLIFVVQVWSTLLGGIVSSCLESNIELTHLFLPTCGCQDETKMDVDEMGRWTYKDQGQDSDVVPASTCLPGNYLPKAEMGDPA